MQSLRKHYFLTANESMVKQTFCSTPKQKSPINFVYLHITDQYKRYWTRFPYLWGQLGVFFSALILQSKELQPWWLVHILQDHISDLAILPEKVKIRMKVPITNLFCQKHNVNIMLWKELDWCCRLKTAVLIIAVTVKVPKLLVSPNHSFIPNWVLGLCWGLCTIKIQIILTIMPLILSHTCTSITKKHDIWHGLVPIA